MLLKSPEFFRRPQVQLWDWTPCSSLNPNIFSSMVMESLFALLPRWVTELIEFPFHKEYVQCIHTDTLNPAWSCSQGSTSVPKTKQLSCKNYWTLTWLIINGRSPKLGFKLSPLSQHTCKLGCGISVVKLIPAGEVQTKYNTVVWEKWVRQFPALLKESSIKIPVSDSKKCWPLAFSWWFVTA